MTPGPRVPVIDKHDRMRIARVKSGYRSLKDFAVELSKVIGFDVPGSTVGAWERGTNHPQQHGLTETSLLKAWAKVTGFDVAWLTFGTYAIMEWNAESTPDLQVAPVPPDPLQMELWTDNPLPGPTGLVAKPT